MRQVLKAHPEFAHPAVTAISAEASRPEAGALRLRYLVQGDLGRIAVPAPAASTRTDELWRRTCLEAFVRNQTGDAYLELNVSPSSQWAAYEFSGYRVGMAPATGVSRPRIEVATRADTLELTADLDLDRIDGLSLSGPWKVGLSAVIAQTDGGVSYWALRHPPGRPDFHHADCFALELPAPEGP